MSQTAQPPNPQGPPNPPPAPAPAGRGGRVIALCLFVVLGLFALYHFAGQRLEIAARGIGGAVVGRAPGPFEPPPEFRELIDANQQHLQIAMTIAACHQGLVVDAASPASIGLPMLIGLNPYGGYDHARPDMTGGTDASAAPRAVPLTNFQSAVLRLSDATSRARVQSSRVATEQGERMTTYQWAAVIIGAVTTILVGIRSVADIPAPVFLGALAIVFSALGTGCTTINSFFSPADAFNRADRSLAQLRLLHRERAVALLMGLDACAADKLEPDQPTDLRARFVRDWNARLTEILNAAGASAQPASGGSGPTAPGGRPGPPSPG